MGLLAAKSQLIVGLPLSDTVIDTIVVVEYKATASGFDVDPYTHSTGFYEVTGKSPRGNEFSGKSQMLDEIHRQQEHSLYTLLVHL